MPNQNWKSNFDEAIKLLPQGRKLWALKGGDRLLAKEIPKSEHMMPKV